MERKEWALLVIAAANKAIQPVQLQKALFLIGRELQPHDRQCSGFYKFRAYDYGPFSAEIYSDVEELQAAGEITVIGPQSRYRTYKATDQGTERARELRGVLSDAPRKYLDEVVAWVLSLSFDDLVRAIYKAYPDTARNSVFRR